MCKCFHTSSYWRHVFALSFDLVTGYSVSFVIVQSDKFGLKFGIKTLNNI